MCPLFHLQLEKRYDILDYLYEKFEKSNIATLCKPLAECKPHPLHGICVCVSQQLLYCFCGNIVKFFIKGQNLEVSSFLLFCTKC